MGQYDKHISENYFFEILQKRLREYKDAILGTRSDYAMELHMQACWLHHIEELRKTVSNYKLLNSSFWGYGVNNISDGVEEHSYPDVFEIKKIGGLNKHLESYRNLLLLTFKVEGFNFFVSTFCIDSCGFTLNSNVNRKYDLREFDNAQIKKRGSSIIIEFIFKNITKPIRFQIDTYHFGGHNLSGEELAKYYLEKITVLAKEVTRTSELNNNAVHFLKDFIMGIKSLQSQDINAFCIKELKLENKKNESSFRYWFKTWFDAKDYFAIPEQEKGKGRIDLRVTHSLIGDKVVEFKGWWNDDKNEIVNQLYGYLTDFEDDGYIFMINHTTSSIIDKYKKNIMEEKMNYQDGTWEEISFKPTGYTYFRSKHTFIREKTVYHFIFSVH